MITFSAPGVSPACCTDEERVSCLETATWESLGFFVPFNYPSSALYWAKRGQSPRSNDCYVSSPAALLTSTWPFFLNCRLVVSIKSVQGLHLPWLQLWYKPPRKNKNFHCCLNSLELLNSASPKYTHIQCRKKIAILKSAQNQCWSTFSCHFVIKIITFLPLRHSLNSVYCGSAAGIKIKTKIDTFPKRLMGVNQGCESWTQLHRRSNSGLHQSD